MLRQIEIYKDDIKYYFQFKDQNLKSIIVAKYCYVYFSLTDSIMIASNNELLSCYNINVSTSSYISPIKVCNMKLLNFNEVLYLYNYVNKKMSAMNPITKTRLIAIQEILQVVIAKWDDWN